jgi:hypothetical protein
MRNSIGLFSFFVLTLASSAHADNFCGGKPQALVEKCAKAINEAKDQNTAASVQAREEQAAKAATFQDGAMDAGQVQQQQTLDATMRFNDAQVICTEMTKNTDHLQRERRDPAAAAALNEGSCISVCNQEEADAWSGRNGNPYTVGAINGIRRLCINDVKALQSTLDKAVADLQSSGNGGSEIARALNINSH